MGRGRQVRVARAHGAGRPAEVARVVGAGLAGSLVTGLALAALLYTAAPTAFTALGASDAVLGPGTSYLRIVAWSVPAAAITVTLQAACAGVGATRITLYTALTVNAVNLPLGAALIFGAGWGIEGAAVATTAAVTGAVLMGAYGHRRLPRDDGEAPGTREISCDLWRLGWPEMTTLGVGYINEVLLAGFAARIGTADLAAYRLVDTLTLVLFIVLSSVSTALTVLAGQELGAGRQDRAIAWHRASRQHLLLLLAVCGALALALAHPAYGLASADDGVTASAWAAPRGPC
ncbi:MATE family efflux transporter [Streptomyces sp. PT12]|uniref:MATE family efflux transporter n=1 Tax=Streptomyces sp. PT12 TaxID=1510197 RepID=UPI000DE1EE74|nr:MATE family efflux transporter [Streptomyces sp. PT12]RBM23868.1 hypothetical protein DEH69_00855 [Streptomyces sp. PT12]